jgi:hypothetical protein
MVDRGGDEASGVGVVLSDAQVGLVCLMMQSAENVATSLIISLRPLRMGGSVSAGQWV